MKIAMFHGYLLHGTGSNIYVQHVTNELIKLGHEVHLFCQECHPERYPFIKRAIRVEDCHPSEYYYREGETGAILINPMLELLPVYVMDKYPDIRQVKLFIKLSQKELGDYTNHNLSAYTMFFERFNYDIVHSNHLIMMPYFAGLLQQKYQIPYIITPHGSSLVYTIQKDPRYEYFAIEGLRNASCVVTGNSYFRDRLIHVFKRYLSGLLDKMRIVSLGVDTNLFTPIFIENKKSVLTTLRKQLSQSSGGKTRKDESVFLNKISSMNQDSIDEILRSVPSYSQKKPDESIIYKLKGINPLTDRLLMFSGRLIVGKGIHVFLGAIIPLLSHYPDLKVLIVGAGPMREWSEWVVHAGSVGNLEMLKALIKWARTNFNGKGYLWEPLTQFITSKEAMKFQSYRFNPSHVIFTGFLEHGYFAPLLALAEWACFPSLVPESFGLVLVEAASCGVIPIASYFSGFKEILDQFKDFLPGSIFPLLTLPNSGAEIIPRLIEKLTKLIEKKPKISSHLRRVAVLKYSWESTAVELDRIYSEIIQKNDYTLKGVL
ncbi:MAG: glycosyltransferase family 4 protein [Candidatus Heimdallarchaeota archaeon]